MSFLYRSRARYAECDAQGIVFNARWGEWVDLATTELLRALLGDPSAVDYRLVAQQTEWRRPGRFDDVVTLAPVVLRIGTSSFVVETTCTVRGEVHVVATTTYVLVADGVKRSVPDTLRALLLAGAPGRVVDHAASATGTVRDHRRLAEAAPVPWRNGGGTTRELWREGDGACGFALRVSLADVDAAGPFSTFPGVDRVLVLLEGDGFRLTRPGVEVTLARPGAPFAFPGDDAWDCALLGGPTRDLNVMVDRATHRAAVVPRAPGQTRGRFVVPLLDGRVGGVAATRWDLLELDGEVWCDSPFLEIVLTPA